jgi:hypoxanthine phosphoribosyltransferase
MSIPFPKQDPAGLALRATHSDGRVYFSYAQIHRTICALVPKIKEFKPDVIVAIGGGGFIPARMLRTQIKIPILAVSLEVVNITKNKSKRRSAFSFHNC